MSNKTTDSIPTAADARKMARDFSEGARTVASSMTDAARDAAATLDESRVDRRRRPRRRCLSTSGRR